MSSTSYNENCHQYDWHSCVVFDDYNPISYCPSKGLIANVAVLLKADFYIDGKSEVDIESWLSNADKIINSVPSLCIVELIIPNEYYQILFQNIPATDTSFQKKQNIYLNVKKATNKFITIAENALERYKNRAKAACVTEDQIETNNVEYINTEFDSDKGKRSGYSQSISKDLKNLFKQTSSKFFRSNTDDSAVIKDVNNSEEEETADIVEDPEESIENLSDELAQMVNFLKQINTEQELPVYSSSLEAWLSCLKMFLKAVETLNFCAAMVLLIKVPEECEPGNKDISIHLSKSFREELKVPVISSHFTSKKYFEILELCSTGRILRAAMTPIPIEVGDHVYREIRDKGALKLIQHHGIYTGHGRLIHFCGNEMSLKGLLGKNALAKIRSTSILRFMGQGSRIRIRKYKKCDPPDVALYRAEEALAHQSFPSYNLIINNCEHFCYYCKTGTSKSKQVEKGVKVAAIAGAVALTLATVALAAKKSH